MRRYCVLVTGQTFSIGSVEFYSSKAVDSLGSETREKKWFPSDGKLIKNAKVF